MGYSHSTFQVLPMFTMHCFHCKRGTLFIFLFAHLRVYCSIYCFALIMTWFPFSLYRLVRQRLPGATGPVLLQHGREPSHRASNNGSTLSCVLVCRREDRRHQRWGDARTSMLAFSLSCIMVRCAKRIIHVCN